MNDITKQIRNWLLNSIDLIDSGNSNIDSEGASEILLTINNVSNRNTRVSKYRACEILHLSRSTFDNYVREGKLPRGEHAIGFKELSWSLYDLDKFKEKYWNK